MESATPQAPPAAELPHPTVWTVNLIVLSTVLFSASFGIASQIFSANRQRREAEEAMRKGVREKLRRGRR